MGRAFWLIALLFLLHRLTEGKALFGAFVVQYQRHYQRDNLAQGQRPPDKGYVFRAR